MSTRRHPQPPGEGPALPDDLAAGLALQIHNLGRRLDELDDLPTRVDDVTRLVGQLTDTVTAVAARRGPVSAPSWLSWKSR